MQIKQVELLVGMSQKNIRFYEKEGLLCPRREAGNGYRSYTDEDVDRLRRIKLLRKLDVPLSEIAVMLEGRLTLAQGMRRHLVTLENRRKNLDTAQALCAELAKEPGLLAELDAAKRLEEMARLEETGVRFVDVKERDRKKRARGAWLAAGIFVALMLVTEAFLAWALSTEPAPLGVVVLLQSIPLVFLVGALLALRQRIQEIKGGEIDDYRNY